MDPPHGRERASLSLKTVVVTLEYILYSYNKMGWNACFCCIFLFFVEKSHFDKVLAYSILATEVT